MKMVEYQHRCEYGGNDVTLECTSGWDHGELVLVVSKHELMGLLIDVQVALRNTRSQEGTKKLVKEALDQIRSLR